jgi:hypothetical protein
MLSTEYGRRFQHAKPLRDTDGSGWCISLFSSICGYLHLPSAYIHKTAWVNSTAWLRLYDSLATSFLSFSSSASITYTNFSVYAHEALVPFAHILSECLLRDTVYDCDSGHCIFCQTAVAISQGFERAVVLTPGVMSTKDLSSVLGVDLTFTVPGWLVTASTAQQLRESFTQPSVCVAPGTFVLWAPHHTTDCWPFVEAVQALLPDHFVIVHTVYEWGHPHFHIIPRDHESELVTMRGPLKVNVLEMKVLHGLFCLLRSVLNKGYFHKTPIDIQLPISTVSAAMHSKLTRGALHVLIGIYQCQAVPGLKYVKSLIPRGEFKLDAFAYRYLQKLTDLDVPLTPDPVGCFSRVAFLARSFDLPMDCWDRILTIDGVRSRNGLTFASYAIGEELPDEASVLGSPHMFRISTDDDDRFFAMSEHEGVYTCDEVTERMKLVCSEATIVKGIAPISVPQEPIGDVVAPRWADVEEEEEEEDVDVTNMVTAMSRLKH